jgi:hypothetical protein
LFNHERFVQRGKEALQGNIADLPALRFQPFGTTDSKRKI